MQPQNKLKMIFASSPGIGKTVLLGSIVNVPELMPSLLIDFEGNTDSIESKCHYVERIQLWEAHESKLTTVRVHTYDDFISVLDELVKCDDNEFPYKSVSIDSGTVLNQRCLETIVKKHTFKRAIPGIPSMEDFRVNLEWMRPIFYRIANLPCHCFMTAHKYKDEDEGKIYANFVGQMRESGPGIFKQLGFMVSRNDQRVIYFQPKGPYDAKDCSEGGKLGKEIVEPTMEKIYKLRYGV